MGALKHVVLPLFALVHANMVYVCMDLGRFADAILLKVENEADYESTRQLHMQGGLRAFNIAFCFLCVIGVVMESAHFRGIVAFADAIMFAASALDALQLGLHFEVPAIMSAILLIGVFIHSREPGIFTKDKNKEKSK